MIVHAFICRQDDWILDLHLRAYGSFCDRIICILDRSPQSEAICRRHPNVEVHHFAPSEPMPDFNDHGVLWHEGKLRQLAWDLAAQHNPDWIALGDTDEIPTPDIVGFVKSLDPNVDVYYADWVNLWRDKDHALGGASAKWSFQNCNANKKGILARRRDGVEYKYNLDALQHTRLEPNPISQNFTRLNESHVLVESPKLVHYKYARTRWFSDPLRLAGGQYSTMERDATVVPVPNEWHWPGLPDDVG